MLFSAESLRLGILLGVGTGRLYTYGCWPAEDTQIHVRGYER